MSRLDRWVLAGWTASLAVATAALWASGSGTLAPPPLESPDQWFPWLERRDPTVASFAILRLVGLFACGYLGVTTVIGAVLRLTRADALVALVDHITVAPVRKLLAGSLTITLAGIGPTGLVGVAAAQPATAGPHPTETTATSTSTSTSASTPAPTSIPGNPPITVTMRLLDPGAQPAEPSEPNERSGSSSGGLSAPADGPQAGDQTPRNWTVEPGECFWTIAEDLLLQAWGRAPTDAEIVPYWRDLIDANRSQLADPGNADLIFPEQVFTVPTPEPTPPAPP